MQLGSLHRRAKAKLVRNKDGRYDEEQGNGGVICFSLIGCPDCTTLVVYAGAFSFACSLWVLRRIRHSVYNKRLGNYH